MIKSVGQETVESVETEETPDFISFERFGYDETNMRIILSHNDSYLDGKEVSLHSELLLQRLSKNISANMLYSTFENLDDKVLVEDGYFQWYVDNMRDGDVIESLSDEFLKTKDQMMKSIGQETCEERQTFSEATKIIAESVSKTEDTLLQKMKGIWRFFIESVETEESPDFISFGKFGAGLQTGYDETNMRLILSHNDSYLDGKEISLHSKLLLQCLSNNISVDMLHNILKNLDDKVLVEDEYFQWCLDNMSDGDVIESPSDELLKTKDQMMKSVGQGTGESVETEQLVELSKAMALILDGKEISLHLKLLLQRLSKNISV